MLFKAQGIKCDQSIYATICGYNNWPTLDTTSYKMRPFVATTTGPLLAQLATRFHSDVVQGTGNKISVKDIISSKCVIVKQKTIV